MPSGPNAVRASMRTPSRPGFSATALWKCGAGSGSRLSAPVSASRSASLTAGHPAASNAFASPAPIAVASGFSAPITNPVSATAHAVPLGFVSSAFTGLATRNARSTRTRDTPSAFWSAAALSGRRGRA